MSDNREDGTRDVLHFFCDAAGARVMRSKGGVDAATPELRETYSLGMELLQALAPGERWERTVTLDSGLRVDVRWTYERDEEGAHAGA